MGRLVGKGDQDIFSALSDHHSAWAFASLVSQQLSNFRNAFSLQKVKVLDLLKTKLSIFKTYIPLHQVGKSGRFRFIAKENVHVWHNLLELISAQIGNVRGREIETEELSLTGVHMFGHAQLSIKANEGMKASCVEDLGLLDQLKVVLQVLQVKLLGSTQVGTQRSVLSGDQTGTRARGHFRIHKVADDDIVLLGLLAHLTAKLIITDGAHEGSSALLRKEPLGDANGILSSTTGNVLHFELLCQVLAQVSVLVTCKDGIVWLQIVLVQKVFSDDGRHVQERIAETKNISFTAKRDS